MWTLLLLPALAQDQSGQGDTGQGQSQSVPISQTPLQQITPDQNTIRNNPYEEMMRQMGQRSDNQQGMNTIGLPGEQSQFQKYVADSLGQSLPVFGTSFFLQVPTTFAPIEQAPVTTDYVIGPGDEVVIHAWGQVDVDYRDVVDRNGNLYVPKIGTLHLAGLRYDQLHDYVQSAASRLFRNFQMNVTLGSLRSIRVFVVGYASRPGGYSVSSMSTLVNAIFAAGGPAANGSMRHIQLRRGSEVVTDFDLYELLLSGDKSKDRQLLPGDVIYFAAVGPQVALAGSVNRAAIYELREHDTLGDLLKMAGGISAIAASGRASVERIDGHRTRQVAQFLLREDGLKRELQDGDIVSIAPVSARFENAVTLRGNVSAPGRHPWHEGMRVKDLVPDLYTLVTERYWQQQNQIVHNAQWGKSLLDQNCQPGSPYEYSASCTNQHRYSQSNQFNQAGQAGPNGAPGQLIPMQSPGGTQGVSPAPYPYPGQGPYGASGQYSPNAPYTAKQGGTVGYGSFQPYYPPYQGQPLNQFGNQAGTSTLASAQQLESGAQAALKMEISRTAPEVNWDYALIERLNMEDLSTRLIPFNLRRALTQPNSEDNLMLKPGDVVTVFSQDDMRVPIAKQSRYVYLEGEVKTPGVYRAEPGETLRQLVERVGGLTENAYLFGSEFTRESARAEQQMRLDQAINEFEQEIQRNSADQAAASSAASATPNALQESVSFSSNLRDQQQLLDRLKQVQADGRMVLGIRPWDNSTADLPDLLLEDGDRLVVPSKPSFVNVVGAVYNTSSYIYHKNSRVVDYLRAAGGGTRIADPKRAFVVRADGSVVRKTSGAFSGNVMSARLMPGDTVVVPQQLNKVPFMRNLKDWSQVLSSFGLAAAAVNILK